MQITNAITQATRCSTTTTRTTNARHPLTTSVTLQHLIHQRRQLPCHSTQRKQISWAIRKQLYQLRRLRQETIIEQAIHRHQGLKHISGSKRHYRQQLIPNMVDASGANISDRQEIADVFASFYADLYRRRHHDDQFPTPTNADEGMCDDTIQLFTEQELDKAISQLRNGRCRDTTGLIAEMLKEGGPTLRTHLLCLYNDVVKADAPPPHDWKHTTISVIHKSGDTKLPNNYRPISIIPLLYKLFARLLYNRLESQLDSQQTPDQAGFRRTYSTADHLFTTSIIYERCDEWQLPLWVSAVDFRKAFDTISHDKLWRALHKQRVPPQYIRLLQSLYSNQTATVKTDKLSKHFNIERGVKQGDPLSSLLFNALLEDIFCDLKPLWQQRRYGVELSHTRSLRLTNLRFADDILLFTTTLPQLTNMLTDLHNFAKPYGLEMHPDKTYILTNLTKRRGQQAATTVDVAGRPVKVLDYHDTTKYLGRKLGFHNYHTTEIHNRINNGWRQFNALRDVLTNNKYPLKSRIRLFDATITPTVLYGCTSWTTTKDLTTTILRTPRRMLRLIIGAPRRRSAATPSTTTNRHEEATEEEPWQDFIKRTTTIAERLLSSLDIETWDITYWRRKWQWTSRLAEQHHDRWSRIAYLWQPQIHHRYPTYRRQGRPRKRWDDEINHFIHTTQQSTDATTPSTILQLSTDQSTWADFENNFIEHTRRSSSTKAI